MPQDKWGHPFFYPSKSTAGLSGSGSGFFWEQNNDIFEDNKDGMVRLGKEFDRVEVIDEATGEWEFPYLTSGDGLSISGPTGHHSGGETHGCQGFTYMCDGQFNVNPPRFRFRKETYHVQYNDHPDGEWTSTFATGPVANNWKGYGWVRYNKKDGRGPGKDSVICEAWWNDDPIADPKAWKMMKRVEDKGKGVTNWGVKATCDGEDYQVGTWSNIQFRFKSAASDFSLHPLIPEGEDDPNVHSIGKEDMSFSDSEARGYGKRADMPRDIEMKCLIKWDAGGRGKCHFKNISLREIDPTKDFDDDPGNPPPEGQPAEPTEVKGFLKLLSDVNNVAVSACAGAGSAVFYDQPASSEKALIDTTAVTEQVSSSLSPIKGKIIKQLDVPLKKTGSFAGTVFAQINNAAGDAVIYTSPTTFVNADLTGSFVEKTFDFSTNTHAMGVGESIGITYTEGTDTDYVSCGFVDGDTVPNSTYSHYDSGWFTKLREFACRMWE